IYMENKAIYDKAITTFIHYDGTIGYADCVNIEIMKELGISKIASFDADFDKVDGILRIY
ncbi:MAG: PIN domain-containing protein, partial [Methanobacteriaceae archaeon]